MDNEKLEGYEDLLTEMIVENPETTYRCSIYKKEEDAPRGCWAWKKSFYDNAPTMEDIRQRWGEGFYLVQIVGKNKETKINTSRSFRISRDDDRTRPETLQSAQSVQSIQSQRNDVIELMKILIPLIRGNNKIDQVGLIDTILKNQVKSHFDLMNNLNKNMIENSLEYKNDDDEANETEEEEGQEMNNEYVFQTLEQYLPVLLGKDLSSSIAQIIQNPIANVFIKNIISNSKLFTDVRLWLNNKVGESNTRIIMEYLKKVS